MYLAKGIAPVISWPFPLTSAHGPSISSFSIRELDHQGHLCISQACVCIMHVNGGLSLRPCPELHKSTACQALHTQNQQSRCCTTSFSCVTQAFSSSTFRASSERPVPTAPEAQHIGGFGEGDNVQLFMRWGLILGGLFLKEWVQASKLCSCQAQRWLVESNGSNSGQQ